MPAATSALPLRSRRHDALSELRRKEILFAATRVFGKKGFEATRADDIAAAAKIAKGTLYLYFKSKEAIYAAAVTQAVRELQTEIAQRSAGAMGFEEKLHTAIRVRLEFWPEHDAIYRLLMTVGREATHRKQTNEVLRWAHSGFMSIFTDAADAGSIEAGDFVPLAWATMDMVRGANERRMDRLTEQTPQEDAAWITAFVLSRVRRTTPTG